MAPALDNPEAQAKENKQSVKVLEELLSKLAVSKTADDTKGTAQEIAVFINGDIQEQDAPVKAVESLKMSLGLEADNVDKIREAKRELLKQRSASKIAPPSYA